MNTPNKPVQLEVQPRDLRGIGEKTGNLYESVAAISKRANQLAEKQKEELHAKLAEFAPNTDNLEEMFENREQIEISTFYERQPKVTLIATDEFVDGKVYFRNPHRSEE